MRKETKIFLAIPFVLFEVSCAQRKLDAVAAPDPLNPTSVDTSTTTTTTTSTMTMTTTSTNTSTDTNTQVLPAAPTCTITRLNSITPQNSVAEINFEAHGVVSAASLNGTALTLDPNGVAGPINISPSSPNTYTIAGAVVGPGGVGACDASFSVPTCSQSISATTTQATSQITLTGPIASLVVNGTNQTVPAAQTWTTSYTESYASVTAPKAATITATVASAAGDSFSCNTNFTIPAIKPTLSAGGIVVVGNGVTLDYSTGQVGSGYGCESQTNSGVWDLYYEKFNYDVTDNVVGDVQPIPPDGTCDSHSVMVGQISSGWDLECATLQNYLALANGTSTMFNWDYSQSAQCPAGKVLYGVEFLAVNQISSDGQYHCSYGNGCRVLYCADVVCKTPGGGGCL